MSFFHSLLAGSRSSEAFTPDVDTFDTEGFASYSIPVTVAVRDTFTGPLNTLLTAHSPETGGAWSLHPHADFAGDTNPALSGTGTVFGRNGSTLVKWLLSATSALSESYEVSYKLKVFTTIVPGVYTGVTLDSHATNKTGYQCLAAITGANTIAFTAQKVLQGFVTTNLNISAGNPSGYIVADGQEYDIRWQIDRRYIGNSGINEDYVVIRVWVNGVKIAEFIDSDASVLPSTKRTALVFTRAGTATTGHHFQGVSIHDISESEVVSDTVRIDPSTVGKVVKLRGFKTAWDATVPTFLVSGATKTAQSIVDYSTATITLTTGATSQLITITDPSTGTKIKLSIANNVSAPMLSGWSHRKQLKVTGSTEGIGVQTNYPIPLTIHTGSGTDTDTDVYIGTGHRADWGDIRITDRSGQSRIPFAILRRESTYIEIEFAAPIINYSEHSFFLYWGKPASAGSVFKIASITDQHYDTDGAAPDNRQQSLSFIDNFVARMATYLPDLALNCGDKTGASTSNEATQLGWYQAVLDHFAPVSAHATIAMDGVSPGNHDFEYPSFAGVLAKHSGETWMETGVLYGAKDCGDYILISLDSNYNDADDTHLSIQHNGYGYIDATQLAWLTAELAAATKPVIIDVHHPLCEFDSEQFTLTREIYHTKNRAKVRKILEDSGKVVMVKHGHVHFDRIDVINGIPYVITGNLTSTGGFNEKPATNTGNFTAFELDADARTILVRRESRVSGVWVTVYEQRVPFGITQFSSDIADYPERVYQAGGMFEKAAFYRSPVQSYVNDDAFTYKFPVNQNVPDPRISDYTIKLEGRTSNPSFGRDFWNFGQFRDKRQVLFRFRSASLATKYFRLAGDTFSSPGVYLAFNAAGQIQAANVAVFTTLQAYVIDTWYKVRIIANVETDKYSVYIDDVLVANDFSFNNNQTHIRQLEIITETGNAFVDALRVRKYASPEPTLEFV